MYVYVSLALVWFEFLLFMFIFSILSAISGLSGLLIFWRGGRVSCKEGTLCTFISINLDQQWVPGDYMRLVDE